VFGLVDGDTFKKVIVTTTINKPTVALKAYARMEDWHLVVVGDKNTPSEFLIEGATYLSPEMQESAYSILSQLIGWKTIRRRNLGFLWALEAGAEVIATVDDDNAPLANWGKDLKVGKTVTCQQYSGELVMDPISVTNYPNLWHRGFPLQMLQQRTYTSTPATEFVDVEAAFWNGDPDIDAICRMEHAPDCVFDPALFPFSFNRFSPFNSQNTFLSRRALKNYFMFPFVGRMDDIWAAYYIQSLGFKTLYSQPSVHQHRNPHDLTVDFEQEVVGYLKSLALIQALESDPEAIHNFIPESSSAAFKEYLTRASFF
jgi:hypothetical protein